ncbi:FkbM family methyltransferase [Halorubrum sp. BOL3-1]|uniref:FkbM family methyltransferase n=1 Tax=Halorubrum sp. BOL3-1 TaxID=2497325 RepID=UPI00100507B9|nr:FkbM family methyltransferase [Halorubrum sp. BOL3-1]QAU13594.1 FkbM family methyltransferase [Halorubrum sp. BOL3-1]
MTGLPSLPYARVERLGFRTLYRLVDLTYALGVATPKRTVAGTYWSYEPTNPHGDDPGLAALDRLPGDAVVVDAGAHVGEHAVPLARGTDRRVVAFEPNGESADRLARNAERNEVGDRIDLRRAGLGDANATLTFYRSTFSKCSAFDRDSATRWGASVAGTESVPVRRLDDLVEGVGGPSPDGDDPLPPPDAVKVDVEGHEAAVLRGAAATIEAYRPLLVVEVHEAEPEGREAATAERDDPTERDGPVGLREWLAARGYAVEDAGDAWVCRPVEGADAED